MKVLLSWLQEYIDLALSPAQIGKMLTLAGLEVDAIETTQLGFKNIVVGRVTKVDKHPDADKLSLAEVTDGEKTYQVVCGAPNCRVGLKTAFAPVGASLAGEDGKAFKIKRTKIRGVESFGMLCSGKELGLSDEADQILEFDEHLAEGADLSVIYADTVFEISLTPNLNHCANVIGVARELSAATGEPIHIPSVAVEEQADQCISDVVKVSVRDEQNCPRYACRLIRGVEVQESPGWLKRTLEASGIRPVNNIVDVTNYVLLEMGHPLHAFDFNRLDGHEIIVRTADEGENFVTLDDKSRILKQDNLLICDRSKPVAIAGVMGGINSEVCDDTRDVLLEGAYFAPSSIRRASKQLGIQTEASKRFERGTDPNSVLKVLDRATMMIQQLAGGKVAAGIVDVKAQDFPDQLIACRLSRINTILGTRLSMNEVETIFSRLGFNYTWDKEDTFTVTVPTYRVDITGEIDLIEEVARIYGYDNIEKNDPTYHSSHLPHAPIYLFEQKMRSRLISEGLQEFLTCDLIGPSIQEIIHDAGMPEESTVKILNPTSIEQSVLRTSLLPGFLQLVKYNIDHQNHDITGFEIGRIHFKKGDQYKEQSVAGLVLSGKSRFHHWDRKPKDVDFFDLKGIIESLLQELRVKEVKFQNNNLSIFHSGRQAAIYIGSREVGSLGEIHPSIQRRLDVSQRILFAELDLHELFKEQETSYGVEEIPRFPSSDRDWTLTLDEAVSVQKVFDFIHAVAPALLEDVSLLDLYRSDKLGKGKKNVTFRFVYRDHDKTISQEAVEAEHSRLIQQVEQQLNH